MAVVFHRAVASAVINGNVNLGCLGIERVPQKTVHDAIQGCYDRGGLDLSNNILWQRLDGHDARDDMSTRVKLSCSAGSAGVQPSGKPLRIATRVQCERAEELRSMHSDAIC